MQNQRTNSSGRGAIFLEHSNEIVSAKHFAPFVLDRSYWIDVDTGFFNKRKRWVAEAAAIEKTQKAARQD